MSQLIFCAGILFLTLSGFYRMRELLDVYPRQIGIMIYVTAAVLLAFSLRNLLFRLAARWQISAETALTEDERPPVLYLRSFRSDMSLFSSQLGWLAYPPAFMIRAFLYLPSFEQRIAILASKLGPVVALTDPKDGAKLGAARYAPQDDATWQNLVAETAGAAQMIVLRSDDTENLVWEMRHIHQADHLGKLVIYIQFGGGRRSEVRRLRIKRFAESLEEAFGRPLTRHPEQDGFYTIDDDGRFQHWPSFAKLLADRGARVEPSQRRSIAKELFPFARHALGARRATGASLLFRWVILAAIAAPLATLAGWWHWAWFSNASYGFDFEFMLTEYENYRPSLFHVTYWPLIGAVALLIGKISAWLGAWGDRAWMGFGLGLALIHTWAALGMEMCVGIGGLTSVDCASNPLLIFEMPQVAHLEPLLFLYAAAPTMALYAYMAWVAGLSAEEAGPPRST